jgi:SOS response associated peptidase (SRAP)
MGMRLGRLFEITRAQRDWRASELLHDDHHRAHNFVAEVHDRMPVLLTEEQFAPWLSRDTGAEVLKPASNDYLQRWPVSNRVSRSSLRAECED